MRNYPNSSTFPNWDSATQ